VPLVFQYVDLELIFLSGCPNNGVRRQLLNDIIQETEELIKIFVTSIKTAKNKQK